MKTLIITGMVFGSWGGSYLPLLWGADVLSMQSILFGAVGGFAGIFLGYKLAQKLDLT